MSTNRPTTVNVPQAPETEVLETIAAFNKAFAENDPETYFTFIDPAITLLLPSSPYRIEGVAMDREEFLYSLRKGTTQVQYFHQMQTIVQLYGTTAVVTYHSRGAYGPDGSVAYFKETDVLVKKEDGWKIVHIHLSSAR